MLPHASVVSRMPNAVFRPSPPTLSYLARVRYLVLTHNRPCRALCQRRLISNPTSCPTLSVPLPNLALSHDQPCLTYDQPCLTYDQPCLTSRRTVSNLVLPMANLVLPMTNLVLPHDHPCLTCDQPCLTNQAFGQQLRGVAAGAPWGEAAGAPCRRSVARSRSIARKYR